MCGQKATCGCDLDPRCVDVFTQQFEAVRRYARVNAPAGMDLDVAPGSLRWPPSPGQEGEHRVTLPAINDAGRDAQEFVITVAPEAAPAPTPPRGCGCNDGGVAGWGWLVALVVLRSRAHRPARGRLQSSPDGAGHAVRPPGWSP